VQPPSLTQCPNEPLVDMDRLAEFSGGSMTSLVEITGLYLTQTHEQLERITAALQQGDSYGIAKLAHSSAGASGVCGVVVMEKLFRELEQLGRDSRMAEATPVVEALCRNYPTVKDILINCRHTLPLS
jgi:HPt (histidine-containing phosphotransfer) domain-containing protein